ncbi:glucose dehydrogenase [FAD, quinone] [Lutzomyia longipalpis]|uniref:glucose dehydrogenase [FAD, quinone] n=1 Tax=Lutzomyia longipalpis TaxID=7200 RepID=UPI00248383C9|nr:glucose dehydrogenase [FAD, quinone] [Lutzomyia longipalpis]
MWLPSFHATQLLQLLCLQVFVVKCGMSIHLFNPYQPPVYGFTLDNSIDHYTYLMQNISQHMKDYVTPYPQTYFGSPLPPSASPTKQYDFIIVGSGPAGCVLANRLSENPHWKILLLEAGGLETIAHDIPAITGYLPLTASNWGYTTEPEPGVCWGMYDQKCAFPRGKVLGGTSAINYMIYNRGNRRDFDRWAQEGNYGWSYNEVLPYFKKSERAMLKGLENSPYHNRNGNLNVEYVAYRTAPARAFLKGARQAGYRKLDYNGESQVGTSYVQATTSRGVRHSAASAFLRPIMHNRPNLKILINSRVTKILIDPENKIAYGVEYVRNKKTRQAYAVREVILSAGTFNSPQLLMLSGIGPEDHLNELGIPVLQNLPVGQTMYDHMSHSGLTFVTNTTGTTLSVNRITALDVKDYLFGKGLFTMIGGVESLTFYKSPNSQDPPDWPDAEIIQLGGSFASDEGAGVSRGMNIRRDIYEAVYKPLERYPTDHWSAFVMQFRPKSIGYIRLQDKNPWHWPKFYPNYFKYEEDLEILLEATKEVIRISQTPAMQAIGTRIWDRPLPNCAHLHFGTDDYWRCSIRTLSCTLHHQVGTCKMGLSSDPTTIVDPHLHVHGIQRLRVADNSIIPYPITGHTNAVSFMIGEKCADMIKADWVDERMQKTKITFH